MNNNWLWKILLIPAAFLFVFGIVGVVYPDLYMSFYLAHTANMTLEALRAAEPDVALLLDVIFRANGLGMTMSSILGIFIIVHAFRKGQKWSIPALGIAFGIGFIGEVLLEYMVL